MMGHRHARILRAMGLAGILASLVFFSACASYYEMIGAQPPAPTASLASAGQHWDKAMKLRSQGKLEQAAEELMQAIKADPDMYHAYYQLGITYTMLGQKEKARQIWEKGISQARQGPERRDYPKAKALGQMQAALAEMEGRAMAPRAYKPGYKTKPVGASARVRPGAITGPYAVLFSSNLNPKYAKADQARLARLGYSVQIKVHRLRGKIWHRVWVGCCSGYERAKQLAAAMRKRGLKSQLTVMRVGK